MGYVSDVRFITTRKGYERLISLIPEADRSAIPFLFDENLRPQVFEEVDGEVLFGWDEVKWYDDEPNGFPGVVAVMRAYSIASEEYPFEYMRFGEYEDDGEYQCTDTEGELSMHLGFRREIYAWR